MSEAAPRAEFVKYLRDHTTWVVQRHEDLYTAGGSDISITAFGRTLWVEAKWLRLEWKNALQKKHAMDLMKYGMSVVIVFRPGGAAVFRPDEVQLCNLGARGDALYSLLKQYVAQILREGP